MQPASACEISLGATTVELRVLSDDSAWSWEIRLISGQTLDKGEATTRPAAKAAAQVAFKYRLKRAGLYPNFAGYRWRDADAAS